MTVYQAKIKVLNPILALVILDSNLSLEKGQKYPQSIPKGVKKIIRISYATFILA